jgi:hypothetical protein
MSAPGVARNDLLGGGNLGDRQNVYLQSRTNAETFCHQVRGDQVCGELGLRVDIISISSIKRILWMTLSFSKTFAGT